MVWNQQLQMYHRPPIGHNIRLAKWTPLSHALSDVERKVANDKERVTINIFKILAVTTCFLIGNLAKTKLSHTFWLVIYVRQNCHIWLYQALLVLNLVTGASARSFSPMALARWSWHWLGGDTGCLCLWLSDCCHHGRNDIDNGMPMHRFADKQGRLAHNIIAAVTEAVVVTALGHWSNNAYNTRAQAFAHIMEQRFYNDLQVTFWLWDRRQSWRNYDGVRFTHHGYNQSMRILISGIILSINHNRQSKRN